MGRLPTREEGASWTPHDDPYDAERLSVAVSRRDDKGRHRVSIRCNGLRFDDVLDVFDAFKRRMCREAAVSKCCLSEDAHADIEARLLAGAEAADASLSTRVFSPVVTLLSTVAPQSVEWLWPNRIAIGKNNMICGDPGLGKSLLALDIAARVSTGAGFPDAHQLDRDPAGVVILTQEDDAADTLVPRLLSHSADVSRIAHVQGVTGIDEGQTVHGIDLTRDVDAVRAAVEQVPNCKLVIIDTISDYLGKTDAHRNNEVRAVLNPLAALANECRVAILSIAHLRKGDSRAIHAAMGSIAFVGQSRVAWAITRCQADPRRRLLTCIKNNLADDNSGLAYTIEGHGPDGAPVICWEPEPLRMTADEAMAAQQSRGRPPVERQDAAAWLATQLARGPQPASTILNDATACGLNRRTVQRAFEQLGCERSKAGFRDGWKWSLPEDDTQDDSGDQTPAISHPGHLRENSEENELKRETKYTLPARMTDCGSSELDEFNSELANCNGGDNVPF